MVGISFKRSRAARTVQLVRHRYSREAGRSVALAVGSLQLDADPDFLAEEVRLRDGQSLSATDLSRVRAWLLVNGDPAAAERRRRRAEVLESRLREERLTKCDGRGHVTALAAAAEALALAAETIGPLADRVRQVGDTPRLKLRSDYLAVYSAWMQFLGAAQAAGVAKTSRRASKAVSRGGA